MELEFESHQTALILIDLQHGIVSRELAPHSSSHVVQNAVRVANALRTKGGTVVFVHVLLGEMLRLRADLSYPRPDHVPVEASELVPELGIQPGDVIVAKRQWGAFYGTDLEQQLRRRGIKTIIIGGIATNMGVESTARAAFDHGYELIFVEDAMTSNRDELHHFAIQNLFPVMGRVRSTEQIIEAIG